METLCHFLESLIEEQSTGIRSNPRYDNTATSNHFLLSHLLIQWLHREVSCHVNKYWQVMWFWQSPCAAGQTRTLCVWMCVLELIKRGWQSS